MTVDTDETVVAETYRRHVNRTTASLFAGRVESSGKGAELLDSSGRRYLDCAGFAVFLLGHGHDAVREAVVEQLHRQPLASGMMLNPVRAAAAKTLAAVAPEGLDFVVFATSGAESVEIALKLARLNGCNRTIAMSNAFHGTTLAALSLAGNPMFQRRFEPLLPGVSRVAFGEVDVLERELQKPGRACVIVEPIQGEGGVVLPPSGYLRAVEELCKAYCAILVFDEIQCGLGRAGSWWQCEREGATPDLLLTGKVLSGGIMPVSAVVAREAVYEPLNTDPYLHTTTFGGSPVQCAAVIATIQALSAESVPERAAAIGKRLREVIDESVSHHYRSTVTAVRGRGLLIGVEFEEPRMAGEFFMEMLEEGVVLLPCSTNKRVVRFTPPATLTDDDLSRVEDALRHAGNRMVARMQRGAA